ncbi:MAG TPA: hypothetical protein VGJ87_26440 [Roseiflexaceae bacterium]|jgi:hypothetical protein
MACTAPAYFAQARHAAGSFAADSGPFGLEWLLCGPDLTLDFVRW